MSEPSEPKPDPSGPLPEETQAGKAPEPGPARLEDHPYLRAFLDALRRPSPPPDPQSRQISIFDMLLVTLIAAVVLGGLRMLPEGYSREPVLIGLAVGVLVLMRLRPKRAISWLGAWVLLGGFTAMPSPWPESAGVGLLWCCVMLRFIIGFALGDEHVIARRSYRAILLVFCWAVLVPKSVAWVILPPWLPLALYLVATGIGAWRLWRPAGGSSPPRSP